MTYLHRPKTSRPSRRASVVGNCGPYGILQIPGAYWRGASADPSQARGAIRGGYTVGRGDVGFAGACRTLHITVADVCSIRQLGARLICRSWPTATTDWRSERHAHGPRVEDAVPPPSPIGTRCCLDMRPHARKTRQLSRRETWRQDRAAATKGAAG